MKGMVSAGQFYDVEQFKFYEHVKNSKEGWELTFNWLEDSECNPHTRFVGATIIHLKLQKSYRELEAETKPQVRSKLIELVVQYPLGSIQSKLCQCIAVLAVQMKEWENPISFLFDKRLSVDVLLQILTALPEESLPTSFSVRCNPTQKKEFVVYLRHVCPDVLGFLNQITLSNPSAETQAFLLQCLENWLQSEILTTEAFVNHELFKYTIHQCVSSNERLVSNAADVVLAAVEQMQDEKGNYKSCDEDVGRLLLQGGRLLWNTISQFGMSDSHLCIVEAVTQICIYAIPLIVQVPEYFNHLANMQELLSHSCNSIVLCVLPFWHEMSMLSYSNKLIPDDVFKLALGNLIRKTMYPESFASLEERDEFLDFREEMRRVIRHFGKFGVGPDKLTLWIREELSSCDLVQSNWRKVESLFHAFSCLAKLLSPEGHNQDALFILSSFDFSDAYHAGLVCTMTICVGVYSRWTVVFPDLTMKFLNVAIGSLKYSENAPFYPLRSQEDHAGCVALLKLASFSASRITNLVSFEQLAAAALKHDIKPSSRVIVVEALAVCAACSAGMEDCDKNLDLLLTPVMFKIEASDDDAVTEICAGLKAASKYSPEINIAGRWLVQHSFDLNQKSKSFPDIICRISHSSLTSDSKTRESMLIVAVELALLVLQETSSRGALTLLAKVCQREIEPNTNISFLVKKFMKKVLEELPQLEQALVNQTYSDGDFLEAMFQLIIAAGDSCPDSLVGHLGVLSLLFQAPMKSCMEGDHPCFSISLQFPTIILGWIKEKPILQVEAKHVFQSQVVQYLVTILQGLSSRRLPSWRLDESVNTIYEIQQEIGLEHFTTLMISVVGDTKRSKELISSLPKCYGNKKILRARIKRFTGGKKKGVNGQRPKATVLMRVPS